jgi:putative RNA 2'-phosphotransferase
VLEVDAAAMAADGHAFLLTGNGVWLTDAVPPRYLGHVGPEGRVPLRDLAQGAKPARP